MECVWGGSLIHCMWDLFIRSLNSSLDLWFLGVLVLQFLTNTQKLGFSPGFGFALLLLPWEGLFTLLKPRLTSGDGEKPQ